MKEPLSPNHDAHHGRRPPDSRAPSRTNALPTPRNRVTPPSEQRYSKGTISNTPETPLFHKGDQLFARAGGLDDGAVPVVVEGPLDAIAVTLASAGRYTGVAPLGTSLTETQAAQLRETGRTPIIATDADPAGQAAAQRDYWILTPHKIDPRHAALPEGSDPADLVATNQTDALTQALDKAGPLADTLRQGLLHDQPDAGAVLDALRVVAAQPPHQWEPGLQHVADQLHLPADALAPTLQDLIRAWNNNSTGASRGALGQAGTRGRAAPGTVPRRDPLVIGVTSQESLASSPRRRPSQRPASPAEPSPGQTIVY